MLLTALAHAGEWYSTLVRRYPGFTAAGAGFFRYTVYGVSWLSVFGIVLGHGLMCYGWVYGGFCLSWVMVGVGGGDSGLVEVSARYTVYGEFYLSFLGGWLVSVGGDSGLVLRGAG